MQVKIGGLAKFLPGPPQKVENSAEIEAQKSALTKVRAEVSKLAEYQRIVEQDENLGIPEA